MINRTYMPAGFPKTAVDRYFFIHPAPISSLEESRPIKSQVDVLYHPVDPDSFTVVAKGVADLYP